MPNIYISKPMRLADTQIEADDFRVDVQLLGLHHQGASYKGRIFVNNPEADVETEALLDNGYIGCFFVFGHGGCFGEPGHCDVVKRGPFDPRPTHPLTPITKAVNVTEAFRKLVNPPHQEFTLTIVADPVAYNPPNDGRDYLPEFDVDRNNVLEFKQLRVVTYD